jgi:hypothetical protein
MPDARSADRARTGGPPETHSGRLRRPGLGLPYDRASDVWPASAPALTGNEWLYVLDGEIAVEVDGHRTVLRPDGSVFAPRGSAHAYQNFAGATAKMLAMTMPGGFEHFFAELAVANEARAEPDFARLEELMNDYGMELLAPPLS